MHISLPYLVFAHFLLLRETLHPKYWNFITDKDSNIIPPLHRVFSKEIQNATAHHFLSLGEWEKTKSGSRRAYSEANAALRLYAIDNDMEFSPNSPFTIAQKVLEETLERSPLYDWVKVGELSYPVHAGRPIKHPLPGADVGNRYIDCLTDLSGWDTESLAKKLLKVNTRAIDSFFNICRRRLSILERPLTTARHGAKNYMYANINPRYAQYAVTILRTWHNYCRTFGKKGDKLTPAQRLGIANRKYSLRDILYP